MIRIYVACLAAYNNGILHGEWIDACQPAEAIEEEVRAMLAASPEPGAEEWAIHDHEGFGSFKVSEYMSFTDVAELAEAIEEHGEAFPAFLSAFGLDDVSAARSQFQDAFQGEWGSFKDYAEDYVDSTGMLEEVPKNLRYYFDMDAFARDLAMDYTVEDGDGCVYVFGSNW